MASASAYTPLATFAPAADAPPALEGVEEVPLSPSSQLRVEVPAEGGQEVMAQTEVRGRSACLAISVSLFAFLSIAFISGASSDGTSHGAAAESTSPPPPHAPPPIDLGMPLCSRGLINGRACCKSSCGTCGGPGCRFRLGGPRNCCPAAINAFGRVCTAPSDVGCMLKGGKFDDVCAFGVRNDGAANPEDAAMSGLRKANSSHAPPPVADVCCAASCGTCADDAGCKDRPGGKTACCPQTIRESKQRCRNVQDTVCAFRQWRREMAHVPVAWGVYARSCAEVDAFSTACIGCDAEHTFGLALLDTPNASASSTYDQWRCKGATHTFITQQVMPYRRPGSKVPASDLRLWPRTQALLRQLTVTIPNAKWYVKLDTDSTRISTHHTHAPSPPDRTTRAHRPRTHQVPRLAILLMRYTHAPPHRHSLPQRSETPCRAPHRPLVWR